MTTRGEAAESKCSAPPANAPTRPQVGALVEKNTLSMRTVPWTAGWAAPRQTRRLLLEAPTRRSGLVGAAPGARGRSRGRPAVGVMKTPGSQGSTGGQLWRGIVKPFKVLVQLVRGYKSIAELIYPKPLNQAYFYRPMYPMYPYVPLFLCTPRETGVNAIFFQTVDTISKSPYLFN